MSVFLPMWNTSMNITHKKPKPVIIDNAL
jgi:hypothetical protein